MTPEEITAMAKEAGMSNDGLPFVDEWVTDTDGLQRFAALVAAKEREACASHIEDCTPPVGMHGNRIEIGAVARTCYADAIRARGTKEGV